MKNTVSERKNIWDKINSRLDTAQAKTTELKDKVLDVIQYETLREKKTKKNKHSICELWDNFKRPNICATGSCGWGKTKNLKK